MVELFSLISKDNLKSYSLTKYNCCEFNISEMIENIFMTFNHDFVEFRADDDLKSSNLHLLEPSGNQRLV